MCSGRDLYVNLKFVQCNENIGPNPNNSTVVKSLELNMIGCHISLETAKLILAIKCTFIHSLMTIY